MLYSVDNFSLGLPPPDDAGNRHCHPRREGKYDKLSETRYPYCSENLQLPRHITISSVFTILYCTFAL